MEERNKNNKSIRTLDVQMKMLKMFRMVDGRLLRKKVEVEKFEERGEDGVWEWGGVFSTGGADRTEIWFRGARGDMEPGCAWE